MSLTLDEAKAAIATRLQVSKLAAARLPGSVYQREVELHESVLRELDAFEALRTENQRACAVLEQREASLRDALSGEADAERRASDAAKVIERVAQALRGEPESPSVASAAGEYAHAATSEAP